MNVVIFEDNNYDSFYPISLTRPLWELRIGCLSLRERIVHYINENYSRANLYFFTRDYLVPHFRQKYPELRINDYSIFDSNEDILFINCTIIPDENIANPQRNVLVLHDNIPMIALVEMNRLRGESVNIVALLLKSECKTEMRNNSIKRLEYVWDLVRYNDKMIQDDFRYFQKFRINDEVNNVTIIGDANQIVIEGNVKIDPFVCIDLTNGPVIIRKNTVINSFTKIEGPCYIGEDCIILGARLRNGCSIGDCCRIGGEVEQSIFHGYSNKYHDGFIGHSYIGEWINLGALTTNSDLKNNYTTVKVYLSGTRVNSENIKVGCFIGDFAKTSIGTLINTGTSIGVGSMVVHSGAMAPYHLPSFTWFINNVIIDPGNFKQFIESCMAMTSRRQIDFSESYNDLLMRLYHMTQDNREKEILKWKRMQR
ncbi:MAG: putative sugar nucleotidyl transferase [Spirochaetota bacterium]|nr:putative sugar nucleotidyl transferase [Spirochaetota bacterium]